MHRSRRVSACFEKSQGACALFAVLALIAASGPLPAAGAAPEAAKAPPSAPIALTPDYILAPWTGDLDGMLERGFLRVLTTYSKTFYFADRGEQRGATYEIFRLFEEDLGKKLRGRVSRKGPPLRIVFIPVARDEMFQGLIEGRGDIAASNLTVTPERQAQVHFSVPTYPNVSELLFSGPASPQVATLDDLSGETVFVRRSSSNFSSLTHLNERFAAEGKAPVRIHEAPETLEHEDLIEMVHAGLIPLTVVDQHIADFWQQVFPEIEVHEDVVLRSNASIAWALRKDSPQLAEVVDDFIRRHAKGSLHGNVILGRYLKNANYVKDAASEAERKKFLALIDHFKKYGNQYGIDWLLMAAQGYLESRLDQSVRSPVGAIGVMQIMPSTAQEIGVGDVHDIETNIHAGIKYMRWMIDKYYAGEPISELDKVLFTFASYNAGAGRIAQLRKEAAKRGLDPNVWSRNVEHVVAEKVGAETVTYVANIYKYYIAYQLLIESRDERERAARSTREAAGKQAP